MKPPRPACIEQAITSLALNSQPGDELRPEHIAQAVWYALLDQGQIIPSPHAPDLHTVVLRRGQSYLITPLDEPSAP